VKEKEEKNEMKEKEEEDQAQVVFFLSKAQCSNVYFILLDDINLFERLFLFLNLNCKKQRKKKRVNYIC